MLDPPSGQAAFMQFMPTINLRGGTVTRGFIQHTIASYDDTGKAAE